MGRMAPCAFFEEKNAKTPPLPRRFCMFPHLWRRSFHVLRNTKTQKNRRFVAERKKTKRHRTRSRQKLSFFAHKKANHVVETLLFFRYNESIKAIRKGYFHVLLYEKNNSAAFCVCAVGSGSMHRCIRCQRNIQNIVPGHGRAKQHDVCSV